MTTELPAWNLTDLVQPKDIPFFLTEIREHVTHLANQQSAFIPSISIPEFVSIMDELEVLDRKISRVASYASNACSIDSTDQKAQQLENQIRSLGVEMEYALLFINQEWKRFDDENAERLMSACENYRYHLTVVRKGTKHMLSDAEEKIISVKDINGSEALTTIFDLIVSKFSFEMEGKTITQEELTQYVRNPDPEKRKAAYTALLTKYEEHKDVLGNIYSHVIDDWQREAKLRKYPTSMSVRNQSNDFPDAAIAALLATCKKNAPIFQTYFKKKAKLLGMDALTRYDIYAPLKKEEHKISYDEAVEKILATFQDFHPAFASGAKRIIDQGHIHAQVLPTKRGGAYCSTATPDVTPYVLLSFTNDARSMETLAHELGHGVHSILAEKQNIFHQHAPIPICETASIFSEVLLADKLRKDYPALAQEMALNQIDDFYASIMRQSFFTIFEEHAHKAINNHPTVDELSQDYYAQLKDQFGDMEIPPAFAHEWLLIPHIYHSPFYCYSYSFGNLLSLAFYAAYKKDPQFADTIVAFLAKGGSQDPVEMVKETGFDITSEAFWQSGFDVIADLVERLE